MFLSTLAHTISIIIYFLNALQICSIMTCSCPNCRIRDICSVIVVPPHLTLLIYFGNIKSNGSSCSCIIFISICIPISLFISLNKVCGIRTIVRWHIFATCDTLPPGGSAGRRPVNVNAPNAADDNATW